MKLWSVSGPETTGRFRQRPERSLQTRQVQGQARKAVHWAWVRIRGVHGCNTAAALLRWERARQHHPQRSSQGKRRVPSVASWQTRFGGESLLRLSPAFSREASESAESPQRARF